MKISETCSSAVDGHRGKHEHDQLEPESDRKPNDEPSTVKISQPEPEGSNAGTSFEKVLVNKEKKSVAQLDAELKAKLEGISGEGGEAGLEFEDGKPVAMGRGTRENMFRVI